MSNSRPRPQTRLGCGYVLVSVVLTCVLLAINGLIVTNLYFASRHGLPAFLDEPRAGQAIVFLGPVLLLIVEWWICDVAIDWLRLPERPTDRPKG